MHNDIYVVASTAVIHQKDSARHQESEANIRRPFALGTDAVMAEEVGHIIMTLVKYRLPNWIKNYRVHPITGFALEYSHL